MDYKLYQSDLIKNHHSLFINQCKKAYDKIQQLINSKDTTWGYNDYNIFSVTSASLLFYKLFKDLNFYIRDYIKHDEPLWLQAWLNYHPTKEILSNSLGEKHGFHFHESSYHGYISIDPQPTTTIFRNQLRIQNQPGQIYIGPGKLHKTGKNGGWEHYVKINSPITQPRITIGFNILDQVNSVVNPHNIPLL